MKNLLSRLGTVVALTILPAAAAAQAAERSSTGDCGPYRAKLEQFETFVTERMSAARIPGLALGFFRGSCTWIAAFGLADVENKTPMRVNSSYRTASVQKSMTAVAVLQLMELGKIDLDAEVQRYVPYFPKKSSPITLRQLLSHLGGIPHYVNRETEQHIKEPRTVREAIKIFEAFDLVAEPGTRYSYSSYGYNLLGAAIEGGSGQSYADYMTSRVWRPAGMMDTRLDDPQALIPNRVRGYQLVGGALQNSEFIDVSSRFAAGGARSTVPDLLRFLQAVSAGKLLARSSLDLMFAPARTRDGMPVGYSLGWQIAPIRDRGAIVMNDGGQQETRTFFLLDPATGFGLALAMNLEADVYGPIIARLFEIVAGRPLVLER